MSAEFDMSRSVLAPYAALAGDVHVAMIYDDVWTVFPDSQAVNEALRLLIRAGRETRELAKAS